MRRPCMSVKAATTVSIVPASTSSLSSSSVNTRRVYVLAALELRVGREREVLLLGCLERLELLLGAHAHRALEPVLRRQDPPAAEQEERTQDRHRSVVRKVPVP